MQCESPATVSIVSRADVKLTTDERSLATRRALLFDEEIIVSTHLCKVFAPSLYSDQRVFRLLLVFSFAALPLQISLISQVGKCEHCYNVSAENENHNQS